MRLTVGEVARDLFGRGEIERLPAADRLEQLEPAVDAAYKASLDAYSKL